MSDETTEEVIPTEPVETSTPAPWGEDFNPERAWNTISHLRGLEKELEPKAKSYERLTGGEDLDAFKKIAEAYGFDIPEEEPEDNDWEDPRLSEYEKKLDEIGQWKAQQEANAAANAFIADVTSFASEKEMELSQEQMEFIFLRANANPKGLSKESAKEAFDAFANLFPQPEEPKEEKVVPRKPITGEPASQVPDLETTDDIVKHIQRRLAEGND